MAYRGGYILVGIEGSDKFRLDICWRVGRVVVFPCQARHIEDPQPLCEWVGRIEHTLSNVVVLTEVDRGVHVEATDTEDLTSTDCVARVASSRALWGILNLDPENIVS